MDIEKIVEELGLKVFCCSEMLSRQVSGGYTGDLLSDVMANSRKGDIWVTRQVHQNTVAVAALKELSAIVIVHEAAPDADTLKRAEKEGIPLLGSHHAAFDVVGRIYRLLNG
jgi:predicted transcriptional regulator